MSTTTTTKKKKFKKERKKKKKKKKWKIAGITKKFSHTVFPHSPKVLRPYSCTITNEYGWCRNLASLFLGYKKTHFFL